MILRELLGPMELAETQTLCIHELTKIVMIGKHKNFMLAFFKIVSPDLESLNNG